MNIYFYTGFNKPELVATSLKDLKAKLKSEELVITDNYTGGANDEIMESLSDKFFEMSDLEEYNLFTNVETMQKLNVNSYGLPRDEFLKDLVK